MPLGHAPQTPRGLRSPHAACDVPRTAFGASAPREESWRDGHPTLVEPLSARELEVLRLIAAGLSNQQICERLFLALDTVKGHNRRIFEKLQVQRRTEAVARARALGLM